MADTTTTGLFAQRFEHPALPGRTFVRVVEETIAPAIDVEMNVLGFTSTSERTRVGTAQRRALGFPTWALVHRPQDARFALEITRDLRKAAHRAKTKPGHARDAFAELAQKLERTVPAFLPSFWEEAARCFVHNGNAAFAMQSFEKARAAERAFELKVDEDERSEAYLELALAGAVGDKALTKYAEDLVAAYGAKEGERRFRELCVARVSGGLPPQTGLAKTLRKLATDAKRDPDLADEELVLAVIDSPALARAPIDFWTSYQPVLRRVVAKHPAAKDRLVGLFPKPRGALKATRDFPKTWLDFLVEIDAASVAAQGPSPAGWLTRLTAFVSEEDWRDDEPQGPVPPVFFDLLTKVAPGVRERGVPVDFDSNRGDAQYEAGGYLIDVLEAALELGLPLAEPRKIVDEDWSEDPSIKLDRPFTRDPARVAAHPVYGPLLDESVGRMLGDADFDKAARGKPTFATVRARSLTKRVEALASGGLRSFGHQASSLREDIPSAVWKEFPEAFAKVGQSKAARALAASLQAGVLDELTWPAFEKALHALKPKDDERISFYGTGRHPVLVCGLVAIVFDGAKERCRYDLPKEALESLEEALFLDDDLLLSWRDDDYVEHSCWASKPKETVKHRLSCEEGQWSSALPGGGTTLGAKPVHRGDYPKERVDHAYADDGQTFWRIDTPRNEDGRVRLLELDPSKGTAGRASWPKQLEPLSERTDGLRITDVFLHATPPGAERSLFGVKDGVVGYAVRAGKASTDGAELHEVTRVDGASVQRKAAMDALVDWPGAKEPRPIGEAGGWGRFSNESFALLDEAGEIVSAYGNGGWPSIGLAKLPPRPMLHYLVPRDEAGSRALRAITEAQAETLLVAARLDVPAEEEKPDDDDWDDDDDDEKRGAPMPKTEAALAKVLPELKDKTLRQSVCEVVRAAVFAERDIARVGVASDDESGGGDDDDDDEEDDVLEEVLPLDLTRGYNAGSLSIDIGLTMAFLRGHDAGKLTCSRHTWEQFLPLLPKLLCFLASRELTKPTARTALRRVLAAFVENGVFGQRFVQAEVSAKKGAPILTRTKRAEAWLAEIDGRRMLVREDDGRDDDDAKTFGLTVFFLDDGKEWQPPADVTVDARRSVEAPDLADFVATFLSELDARGAAPFETSGIAHLAEAGGLRPADATFLLAGLPRGKDRYANDFLGKELREKLGLKVNEAKAARDTFSSLSDEVARALYAAAFDVANATDFWALGSEDGSLARTIGKGVKTVLGQRHEVPEDFAKGVERDLSISLEPHQIVALLFDESSPLLMKKPDQQFDDRGDDKFMHGEVVIALAYAIAWLSFERPVGDELRNAVPAMYARLRQTLATPDLLLEGGYRWVDKKPAREKLLAQLGGEVRQVPIKAGKKTIPVQDNGAILAHDDGDGSIDFAFRPAAALTHREQLVWLATPPDKDGDGDDGCEEAAAVLFLTSKECEALVADIEKGKTKDGSFTANPVASAPATVKAVQKAQGFDEDAAALYLQTLALPNPTQKAVCLWNVWPTTRYKKAADALAEIEGLVVSGKRDRAGREIFLPGAWIKIEGLACEAWKAPLLGGKKSVREPCGTLFARAWARASGGDPPRFEETRKKAAKEGAPAKAAEPAKETSKTKAKGKGK